MRVGGAVLAAALAASGAAAETVAGVAVGRYDRAVWSQAVTPCDRLTAYEDDGDRVSPGVPRSAIDLEVAARVCAADIAAAPGHPRLLFQAARIAAYRGQADEAQGLRRAAAAGGYPIAIFSLGNALSQDPARRCDGVKLIWASAAAGAYVGRIAAVTGALSGAHKGCGTPTDRARLRAELEAAAPAADSHFEKLLVESLRRELGGERR